MFFRWIQLLFLLCFTLVVPYCYLRIYFVRYQNTKSKYICPCRRDLLSFASRRNQVVPENKEKKEFRRQRNVVTFSWNMIIWILELLVSIMISVR